MNKILFRLSTGTYQPVTNATYDESSVSKMTTLHYVEQQQILSFFDGVGQMKMTASLSNAASDAIARIEKAASIPLKDRLDTIADDFVSIRD